jgi:aarF domain-containing kinase
MKERSRTTATATASSNKVSDLSKQMKDIQNQLATDNEDANLIMQALRGKNINDDDNQVVGLEMHLIEFDDGGGSSSNNLQGGGESSSSSSSSSSSNSSIGLPYIYDPIALEKFFMQRPQLIIAGIFQVLATGGGVLFNFAFDTFTGQMKNNPELEVLRTAQLRDKITSLVS